jgi:transposase InsO family protein
VKVSDLYEFNHRVRRQSAEGNGKRPEEEQAVPEEAEAVSPESGVRLPEEVQELIRSYRREHPTHGFKRIADLLKQKYLVVVTRKQIRRVLKEAGLLETCDSSFDREPAVAKGTRRFEAAHAGQQWQMDVAYVYLRKLPVFYLAVVVDDYSRYCVAAQLCRDQRAETLIEVLHNACTRYGVPQKLLTDQGSGFYSWSREETQFQQYLDDQRIEHVVAEPHSPQSQGKVERLIQTLRKELLTVVPFSGFADAQAQIASFVASYNFDRPHQGIGGQRPADRFHGVVSVVEQAAAELASRDLDLSRGYVIYQVQGRRVCVVCTAAGLQVYLDGVLLKGTNDERNQC